MLKKLSSTKKKFIRLLQVGPAGSGKTVSAASFPKPIFYSDFDDGIASVATMYKDRPEILEQIDYEVFRDEDADKPHAMDDFEKIITEFENRPKFPYATIIVDTISSAEEAIMNRILKLVKSDKRILGQPNQSDWGQLVLAMEDFFNQLIALPCHVIVNAHMMLKQDEITQEIFVLPMMSGKKLPHRLPGKFDEYYFSKCKNGKYIWQIRPNGKLEARTRFLPSEVPNEIPATYESIAKYL